MTSVHAQSAAGHDLTADQVAVLRVIIPISATFGLLGALITIIGFLAFRHLRTTIARLIFCMAVADFVGIFAKAIGVNGPLQGDTSWLCQTQAALMQWGDLSSIFWTVMISMNLLFIMYWKKAVDDVKRYEKWYILFCFVVPVPMSIVELFTGMYGDAGNWCWIGPGFNAARLAFFYGPLWAVFLFNMSTYLLVGRIIWKMAAQIKGGNAAHAVNHRKFMFGKNTSLYLLAFLITWTPSTLNRLYQFLNDGQTNFAFAVMMAICSPARGFTNFLVYFYLSWYTQVKEPPKKRPASATTTTTTDPYSSHDKAATSQVVSSALFTGRGLSEYGSGDFSGNAMMQRLTEKQQYREFNGMVQLPQHVYLGPNAPLHHSPLKHPSSSYLTASEQLTDESRKDSQAALIPVAVVTDAGSKRGGMIPAKIPDAEDFGSAPRSDSLQQQQQPSHADEAEFCAVSIESGPYYSPQIAPHSSKRSYDMTGSNVPSPIASPKISPVISRRNSRNSDDGMAIVSRSRRSSQKSTPTNRFRQPENITYDEEEFRKQLDGVSNALNKEAGRRRERAVIMKQQHSPQQQQQQQQHEEEEKEE